MSSIATFISYIFYEIFYDILTEIEYIVAMVVSSTANILNFEFYFFGSQLAFLGLYGPAILIIILGLTGGILYFVFIGFSSLQEVLP